MVNVQVTASTYLLVTTVALICVVAFRTAPLIGGLSCFFFNKVTTELIIVMQKLPLDTYNKAITTMVIRPLDDST